MSQPAQLTEANIATTIVCLKVANLKKLPMVIELVAHNDQLMQEQWRLLALRHLERCAAKQQKRDEITLR